MRVAGGKRDNPYMYLEDEICKVLDKLEYDEMPEVGKFSEEPEQRLTRLYNYGFKNLGFSYDRFMFYCPDVVEEKDKGLNQINRHFDMIKYNAIFNIQSAKNGDEYSKQLLELLDKQRQNRIDLYLKGEKVYDYVSTYVLTIWATK